MWTSRFYSSWNMNSSLTLTFFGKDLLWAVGQSQQNYLAQFYVAQLGQLQDDSSQKCLAVIYIYE